MLQLQHEETHTPPAITSEPTLVGCKDLEVAENNVVKDDSLDPVPSRGCPIRHLALQQCKLPPVMLIPEHEGEDNKNQCWEASFFSALRRRYCMQQYACHTC